MTPAEATAIAERHVVHPRAHGDRDVFTHGFDFCNEDKQRWPCDAAVLLASNAALREALAKACDDLLNDEMSDLEHYHMDGQFREFAKRVRAALADVAGEVEG